METQTDLSQSTLTVIIPQTTTNTAKNMHSETHAVGNSDSSSLQASQDEFENMVRNLDVKS
ncbi:hypothetical protein MJI47_28555, partial [Salmonella enterica subsp. enterica serovar Kentucky]|nr:hypothetical protein [Salmonella enterica subsp. enterica serovar Kentucky]